MARFADEIKLSKDEAFDVVDVLVLAAGFFEQASLLSDAASAEHLAELILDRLTPLGLDE